MNYIVRSVSTAVIIFLVGAVLKFLKKPSDPVGQTVILPKFMMILGIICSVLFLIPTVITLVIGERPWVIGIFLFFVLLGTSLIIAYFNCRIVYDENSFTVKNFFGFKRTYTYDQITGISGKNKGVTIRIGKRTARVDEFADGKYQFLSFAKKQYRKTSGGLPIPTLPSRVDIFNGNIENPGEFIFIYILITVFIIGAFIFMAIAAAPKTDDELDYDSISFERYEINDQRLMLYKDGEEYPYIIPAYAELLTNSDRFLNACDNNAVFDIAYFFYEGADDPYNGLESITGSDSTVYLTRDAVNGYYWDGLKWGFIILGGMFVIWISTALLSIYMGRNAHKFSRRTLRLFFKDGYILRAADDGKTSKKKR